MMLGTHNTFTYLTPKKWWMKMINFTAKCQSKNLVEQFYEYNVRFFDLRVKFNDDHVTLAHGLVEYKSTPLDVLNEMISLAESNPSDTIYFRVMFEDNFIKESTRDSQEKQFIDFCDAVSNVTAHVQNLIPVGGCRKTDWKNLYKFEHEQPSMQGYHASVTDSTIDDLWPWLYAKKHNADSYKKGTDKQVLMLDFIEIGHEQIR